MSPQQAIWEKGKAFPWAVSWLQRHSEKPAATRGPRWQSEGSTQQWQTQAACLRLLPSSPPSTNGTVIKASAAQPLQQPAMPAPPLSVQLFRFGCLRYLPGVAGLVIAAYLWEGLIRFSTHWHQVLLDTPSGIRIRLSDAMLHLQETCVFLNWQLRLGRNVLGHLKWHYVPLRCSMPVEVSPKHLSAFVSMRKGGGGDGKAQAFFCIREIISFGGLKSIKQPWLVLRDRIQSTWRTIALLGGVLSPRWIYFKITVKSFCTHDFQFYSAVATEVVNKPTWNTVDTLPSLLMWTALVLWTYNSACFQASSARMEGSESCLQAFCIDQALLYQNLVTCHLDRQEFFQSPL